MKILTVVGARPQFVKAAMVSRCLRGPDFAGAGVREVLVHTGQHYDHNLSQVFFEELGIPQPDYHLGVGSCPPAQQVARMLEKLQAVLESERPDWVLVYGDTNSTLAGALAAVKGGLPLAHVEAGLRSFNRGMPEEINRVLTDHASDLLFCPTVAAVENLAREGIPRDESAGTPRVVNSGDVMYDAVLHYRAVARDRGERLWGGQVAPGSYALATLHRAENTDDPGRLAGVLDGLGQVAAKLPVVMPLHPRTRKAMEALGHSAEIPGLHLMEPMGYLDMLCLEANARLILTDSGGVQKEAYFNGVPCVTLRRETEWVELLTTGLNQLAGCDPQCIADTAGAMLDRACPEAGAEGLYGDGRAAERIAAALVGRAG